MQNNDPKRTAKKAHNLKFEEYLENTVKYF